jgi:hypothetical protein
MKKREYKTNKKKISAATAMLCAIALLLAGTYAWYDFNQSELNEFSGTRERTPDVELVDIFNPDDVEPGADVNKNVYVKNTGEVPLYVRVRLDEYLDLTSNTPNDPNNPANADKWIPHVPNGNAHNYADYFKLALGGEKNGSTTAVIGMAEYNALTVEQKLDFVGWIYDTDGYAYWSQPLQPETETGLLLNSVYVEQILEEFDFYYGINVVLQAVDKDDLPMWTEGAGSVIDGSTTDKSTPDASDFLEGISNANGGNGEVNPPIVDENELPLLIDKDVPVDPNGSTMPHFRDGRILILGRYTTETIVYDRNSVQFAEAHYKLEDIVDMNEVNIDNLEVRFESEPDNEIFQAERNISINKNSFGEDAIRVDLLPTFDFMLYREDFHNEQVQDVVVPLNVILSADGKSATITLNIRFDGSIAG